MDAESSLPGRDWPAQSFHGARAELALFFATLRSVTLGPKRFSAAWADGERRALNPLAFYFTALAFIAPYRAITAGILGVPAHSSLWVNLLKPVAILLPISLTALILHGVLRLAGSRRHLAGTLGIVLFMSGGPGMIVTLYAWPLQMYAMTHRPSGSLLVALAGLGTLVLGVTYFTLFIRGLQGLHGMRWWWMALGVAVSLAAVGPLIFWLRYRHPALMVGLLS